MEQRWLDYYDILEVSHQAGRDVIEAKYRSLCKVFHPDVNPSPDAEGRMKLINIAWEVLGDDSKRLAFNREWEARHLRAVSPAPAYRAPRRPVSQATMEDIASRRAITEYFRGIIAGRYRQIHALLSSRDQWNIPVESFIRWQSSVAASYRIQSFLVLSAKRYEAFPLGDSSCPAVRFAIEIDEKDLRTGRFCRSRLVKFVVKEGVEWHVHLGYRDIEYVVEQFSLLAGSSEYIARVTDPLTCLPNRCGFLEKCRPEVYRCERYGRKSALGVVAVHFERDIADPDLNRRILQQAGFSLRATARLIDIVGVLEDGRFCALMAETDDQEAYRASARVSRKVEQDILACFDIKIRLAWKIAPFDGGDLEKLLAECEANR